MLLSIWIWILSICFKHTFSMMIYAFCWHSAAWRLVTDIQVSSRTLVSFGKVTVRQWMNGGLLNKWFSNFLCWNLLLIFISGYGWTEEGDIVVVFYSMLIFCYWLLISGYGWSEEGDIVKQVLCIFIKSNSPATRPGLPTNYYIALILQDLYFLPKIPEQVTMFSEFRA